ncbi:MAG: phage Gp37/Gp68 family protein [Bacteroidota bacterium]|jgi:protein gp37
MAQRSSIEWTEATWNPVTGCTKISPGCRHCYAERLAGRLKAMGSSRYRNGFNVTLQPDIVDLPLHWKQPRIIFVNSMSDLFHEAIPDEYIVKVFATMQLAHWHTFQILTKRSGRLSSLASLLPWPSNVWIGVSVESSDYAFRIADLVKVPAAVRFLSLEPLLSFLPRLPLRGIDWVIVGGESGPGARPMKQEWVRTIQIKCKQMDVPFFFKQWGGVNKKAAGRALGGRTWNEMPEPRVRKEMKTNVLIPVQHTLEVPALAGA